MHPTLHAVTLQSLADQLADLLSAQVADLREFARVRIPAIHDRRDDQI
jgi:hypothetical protein